MPRPTKGKRFGAPQKLRPRLAGADVRTSGAITRAGELVFRAEGSVAPGIYGEARQGEARLLVRDPPEGAYLSPTAAGTSLLVLRSKPVVPSRVDAVVVLEEGREPLMVPGQSVGLSGDSRIALVADVVGKRLRRVDIPSRIAEEVGTLDGGIDPQLAPVVSLDRAGRRALLMDSRLERGDASLEQVDLTSGRRERLLGPLPAPSWLVAAFAPEGDWIVVLEMRLGDAPSYSIGRLTGRAVSPLWSSSVSQPAAAPAFLDAATMVLPLTLEPYPFTTYGPIDLVALAVAGGAPQPIVRLDEVGRVRVAEGSIWVEGGAHVVRVPWR